MTIEKNRYYVRIRLNVTSIIDFAKCLACIANGFLGCGGVEVDIQLSLVIPIAHQFDLYRVGFSIHDTVKVSGGVM